MGTVLLQEPPISTSLFLLSLACLKSLVYGAVPATTEIVTAEKVERDLGLGIFRSTGVL